MSGARPGKTGGVFAAILSLQYVEDFFGPRTLQMVADRLPQQKGQRRTGS